MKTDSTVMELIFQREIRIGTINGLMKLARAYYLNGQPQHGAMSFERAQALLRQVRESYEKLQ